MGKKTESLSEATRSARIDVVSEHNTATASKTMKLYLLLAGFLSTAASLPGATQVGGSLNNQVWTLAGSPYILTNDLLVPAGRNLTIGQGVTVKARECEFVVEGSIVATGTDAAPIHFTSEIPTSRWRGLRLNGAPASALTHCRFTKMVSGFGALALLDCDTHVSSCVFEDNEQTALFLQNSFATVRECIIRNNVGSLGAAVYSVGGGPRFYNALICNNTAEYFATGRFDTVTMRNCTIVRNWTWLGPTTASAENSVFMNCIIAGNTSTYPEQFYGSTYSCLDYVSSFPPSFKNPTASAGRGSEPLDGLPSDYSLIVNSPGVDQGSNSLAAILATDITGNARVQNGRVDIGCYEYIPNYGLPFVTSIEKAVRVTALSEPGKSYQFQYRNSLGGTNWLNIGDIFGGTGGVIGVFDTVSNSVIRIYRAAVVQP